ncbi:Sec3-PIP2_bind domain-containing protein [Meloidogyne graminicola]|uniref:Sec3-PIP2_bind domain-containing protein n=1 Tax=Meloidogyne graminicola TaxID=189291 RepID=A0A8S9ZN63_9BILA|nr:Sec3-PIP2_bind domain-containing protein [Meloidogyne graminicola]
MASLRANLQKAIFQEDGERLLAVANIKKDLKKRKELYMCLVVTTTQPVSARIWLVKSEKENSFIKKEHYALRDIRSVDGINPRKPLPDFNLTIKGQLYQLYSNSSDEKEFFIRQLFKFSNANLPIQKPEFVNISLPVDSLPLQNKKETFDDSDSKTAELDTNYQPITLKEETDFRNLLEKANLQIGQARQFSASLNNQLSQLDSANLSSIMENEQNVSELIGLIDTALELADCVEKQLDEYDTLLSFVRDSVELIEEKDSLRHIEQQNNKKLANELNDFIYQIEMVQDQHIEALKNANLSDPISINLCSQAARIVDHFITKKTELNSMNAYHSRVEMLNKITSEFVDRFYAHISAIFGNMDSMLENQHIGEIIMQKHSQRHRALLPFSDLISWLKQTRPNIYKNVLDRYNIEAQKYIKKEFDRFFSELARKEASSLNNSNNSWKNLINEQNIETYTNLIETAVAECRVVVESEQKFCIRFFHLNTDVISQLDTELNNKNDENKKTMEKQLNDQIKFAIGRIFEPLPTYFYGLVSIYNDHHITIISIYVVLTRKMSNFCDSSSYFSIIYGSFLVALKRLSDEQMNQIENSFSRISITKRTKIGILDTIDRFRTLAKSSTKIFEESERKVDLDKWLEKLTIAIITGIDNAAESPNSKCPAAVVRMENFHAFHSVLSELKIACLEVRRKELRQKYQENCTVYVKEMLGRPLEKIHNFFERIERLMENGVSPEEISYEQQFSRIELKRVTSAYPAKEVKKGLENLYKKIEKHLSNDSLLLQVVWRQMQEEFLNQIKNYQQLISKCYLGSKIELEVGIDDILKFFSEIAQKH